MSVTTLPNSGKKNNKRRERERDTIKERDLIIKEKEKVKEESDLLRQPRCRRHSVHTRLQLPPSPLVAAASSLHPES